MLTTSSRKSAVMCTVYTGPRNDVLYNNVIKQLLVKSHNNIICVVLVYSPHAEVYILVKLWNDN